MDAAALVIITAVAAFAGIAVYNVLTQRFDPTGREAGRHRAEVAERREERAREGEALAIRLGEAALRFVVLDRTRRAAISAKLKRAGWKITDGTFIAVVLVAGIAGVGLGITLALALPSASSAARIAAFAIPAAVGLAAPHLVLSSAARTRRALIARSLPRALDLLAVVVGAGQTIDAGIKTVAENTQGPLADELGKAARDVSYYGKTTAEALTDMADRCDLKEVTFFTAAVKQALSAGSPMKEILKAQAASVTERRYQQIEEQSNKISNKMLLPMVMLFMPVFIMVLGPSLVQVVTEIVKMS